jgi:hypothetical protein
MIQTPVCPLCSQPPVFILGGGHQAFCETEGCPAFTWDMFLDVDTLMERMGPAVVERTDLRDPTEE